MSRLATILLAKVRSFIKSPRDNIIPKRDEVKSSLIIVIMIMSFLCSLAICSANLLHQTALRWKNDIASESTIEIMPQPDRDIVKDLNQASNLAMGFPGVYDAQILSDDSTRALLEPWLGSGFDISVLPIPRIIIIHLTNESKFDSHKFSASLHKLLPNSRFNSHRKWINELRGMANTSIIVAAFIIGLLTISLVITIVFATRSTISANQDIIHILHFMGAESSYIVRQFDIDFLYKAFKGAAIGSLATIILFFVFFLAAPYYNTSNSNIALTSFFSNFHLNGSCYLQIMLLTAAVSLLTMLTSRFAIKQQLKILDMMS